MTEIHKRYRLTSAEEPSDEMLQALMEDVAAEARRSMAKAEAEKKRRLQAVANEISAWRASL
jgi:F0F1-type ATP synthase assembly protein I